MDPGLCRDDKWAGEGVMKLVLFEAAGETGPQPGLLTERGVVGIAGAVAKSYTPQLTMVGIIDNFDRLRPALDKLGAEGEARRSTRCVCTRRCRGPGKSSAASAITGSMRSASRVRSICS
jgi:hypothetical protein